MQDSANKRSVLIGLWCCAGQLSKRCNTKTADDIRGPACPNVAVAARLLKEQVEEEHGSSACLERARQARADAARTGPAAVATVDLFARMRQAMQQKQQLGRVEGAIPRAEERLRELRAAEAAAVQAREAAEKELAALQAQAESLRLGPQKRQKTAGSSSEEPEPARPQHYDHYANYNLDNWRNTTGEIMNRRAKPVCADTQAATPRQGVNGALLHWRRGLVGAVQDWANGSKDNVVWLLLQLIEHFEVKEAVLEKLAGLLPSPLPCSASAYSCSPLPPT